MCLGPRWNLEHHHRCSEGRDSVGLEGLEVAKVTDFVWGAERVWRLREDLYDDVAMVVKIRLGCRSSMELLFIFLTHNRKRKKMG